MVEILDTKKVKCTQEGCQIHVDGKCLEGTIPIEQCTFLKMIENADMPAEEEESIVDNKTKSTLPPVYSGDTLSINETNFITTSSLTRFVILAGRAEAGKSTLLASLFDLFQTKPSVAEYIFAGSRTLIGFEKICHQSRIASKRSDPKTERTKYTPLDPRFLHLKLKGIKTESLCNLLFTDISGEHFEQISNSSSESKKFKMCNRADHFVLFFDVGQLCDLSERHSTKTYALAILRSLIEAEVLTPKSRIQVVFSKWDLLELMDDCSQHLKFIESIKEEISSKYPSNKWNIRFFNIASRPLYNSQLEFGFGIEPLIKIWSEETQFLNVTEEPLDFDIDVSQSKREYIKYNLKKI